MSMLKKIALLGALSFCVAFANTENVKNGENVELLANTVTKNGEWVEAVGEVLVYSERYLLSADRALYNELTGELELFDNVSVLRGVYESSQSEYAKINLKTDEGDYRPFFYYDQRSDIWMQCESAISGPAYFITDNSVVSSCNVQNPDWKIGFSEGKLNRESSFLHLYNTLFYIRDVPVFYLPYFAFSTDKTRRSGLLIPMLSYGKKEGLFYEQPIYIATQDHWDIEFKPQIRTNRGEGLYATLRFVDSPYSKGKISMGQFWEKSEYVKEEDLENKTHYGLEVEYQRDRLVSHLLEKEAKDGLWVDVTYLNDIDYLNLKSTDDEATNKLITSRINYYLSQENDYYGTYAKYYIDTKKLNNHTTLQELPTLHYHRFSNSFFVPNLVYSFDTQFHNYTRNKGIRARQYEVNAPLTLYTSVFDDFLNLSVSENFYATYVQYDEKQGKSTETFYRNYHQFSAYTDLAKAYEGFYHTLNLRLDYTVPSFDHGEISKKIIEESSGDEIDNFISTSNEPESVAAKLVQYFYDDEGVKRVRHSVRQPYYLEKSLYKYGDLENSIALYLSNAWTLRNDFKYSYEFQKFSRIQSSARWSGPPHTFAFSHTFLDTQADEKESYLTASFGTTLGKYYNVFGAINYDLEDNYMSSWRLGFKVLRKCWDYTFIYKETITPKLTSAGSDSVNRKGFYIMFNFYPIGAVQYEHKVEEVR
ncbi:MAG: LPS-assembly protein LptD [Campylobacterales bacterium]|nr:LPS-assembly protein LptD [Campylobacterales bacterium]